MWCSSDARTIEGVLKAWKEWAKPGNVNGEFCDGVAGERERR